MRYLLASVTVAALFNTAAMAHPAGHPAGHSATNHTSMSNHFPTFVVENFPHVTIIGNVYNESRSYAIISVGGKTLKLTMNQIIRDFGSIFNGTAGTLN